MGPQQVERSPSGGARSKLLDAAISVIREKGYAATSVDELCARAGVTKGAFFHHFPTKDSLAVAAAKAFGGDVAVEVSTEIFALAGTRAADDRVNLHRHWRNARTHTLHDPNRWKYLHIGNFILRGVKPPNHGLI